MSDDTKSTRQKIRTFAHDLEDARHQREEVPLDESSDGPSTKDAAPEPQNTPVEPAVTPAKKTDQPEPKITHTDLIPEPHQVPKTDTPPPAPKKKASRPIPAFHELQKQVNSIQRSSQKKPVEENIKAPKKVKRPKRITQESRPNIGYDAKVISDTKHNRFQLFPSIVSSVKEWFAGIVKSLKTKDAPRYSVPESHRRKGVIQKATSKTGAFFAADNENIREQIRKRQEFEKTADDAPEKHDAETVWSPYTDTGYNLLEEPDAAPVDTTKNVTIEFKRPRAHSDEPSTAPAPTPVPAPLTEKVEPDEVTEPVPVPPAPAEEQEDTVAIDLDEARWAANADDETASDDAWPVADTADTTPAPQPPDNTEPTPEPEPVNPQTDEDETDSRNLFTELDTNTITILVLLAIICILFAVFATRIVFMNTPAEEPETVTEPVNSESIIRGATLATIPLSSSALDTFPELVSTASEEAPAGISELVVVSPLEEEISPSYIFELLRFRTVASLRQSIITLRFATINQSSPGIVMQFVDQDTVRGGLLTWEENMANDLRVLYDIPEEYTESFTDETVEGVDVRVLRIDGEAVLVYGFVGQSSVLITSSTADFAQITQLGFPQ